jgi:signal peptidase
MEPTYHVGGILFIEKVDPSAVQVGDIITFATPQASARFEGTLTTHRVTSIDSGPGALAFHTKGDANNVEDTWIVPAETIVGRGSFSIPYLGYVSSFVRSKTGFIMLVVIPAVLIVFLELASIAKALRGRKQGTSRESIESRNAEELM